MKSLSLTRPMVLVVIGAPGSGKSFFARQFATTFCAPLVSRDYICAQLADFSNPVHDAGKAASAIAEQQIVELLKTQKSIVIDGGYNARADRSALSKLAQEAGYSSLVIWVQTDEPTSRVRATKRSSRRAGDAYNTSLSDAEFQALSKKLTPPAAHEPYVVISGKHTYATQAKIILKKLVQPRQEMAQKPNAYSAQNYDQPQPPTVPRRRNVIVN